MKRMAWALSTDREAQDQSGRRNAWGNSERRVVGTNALPPLPQDLLLPQGNLQMWAPREDSRQCLKVTKAVDSYNCLSTTKAARSNGDWEYETVLFVPYTPDGALATALRAYEKKRGAKRRIRIVERAGISLKSKLFSTNPWSKEGCVRTGCFPCMPGGGREGLEGEK